MTADDLGHSQSDESDDSAGQHQRGQQNHPKEG